MKDLMRLIEQESYQTSDPVTDFLRCLFTNYDFDGAQKALQKCEQVQSIALDSFADRPPLQLQMCKLLGNLIWSLAEGTI